MSIAEKLTIVAENVPKVYEAGYQQGEAMGYTAGLADGREQGKVEGYEEGKQAEYDRVWDDLQQNGNRTYYNTYFSGRGWQSGTTYNPKHPIVCAANGASNMFGGSYVTDTLVPITISGANASVFYGSSIKTIRKLILGSGITSMGDWFTNMASLENITIEGEIPVSTKFTQSTKLTAQSMVSIVEHLSNTATGKSIAFSTTAITNADWSTTEYSSWDDLIATKPNWTFTKA